jgi:hypothetical protein
MKRILVLLFCIAGGIACCGQGTSINKSAKGDSLFFAGNWKSAGEEYERLLQTEPEAGKNALMLNRLGFCYQNLKDYAKAIQLYKRSEQNNPASPFLKQTLYTRMAKVYAVQKDAENSIDALNKAVEAGYMNFLDLDSAMEYKEVRAMVAFKAARDKVYTKAYPCMSNPKAREFDFWIGEWDVYATGSKVLQGHSLIQQVSGGCLILENWASVGAPYNGKSMNFIDSAGNWRQVWMGTDGSVGEFTNGQYRDKAMNFTFRTTAPDGKMLSGRFTFFNQGPAQVRQLQETSSDEGKTWKTVYDFTYIRKK